MSWERDVLVWETAALDPDSPAGDSFWRADLPLSNPKVRSTVWASSRGDPVLITTWAPLPGATQALPLGVPCIPNPLSGEFLVLTVGPLRFFPSPRSPALTT